MLDPDGQGIILTNATFSANIDKYNTIKNYEKLFLNNMTSSVYVTRDGVFLDISQKWRWYYYSSIQFIFSTIR